MKATQLVQNTLSQDAFYQVNKKIFKDLKNINAAFLITSLISKYSYFENRKELNEDNSFFNTKNMLSEELFLDEQALLKAEKLLEGKGYIKTYSKGMPKKKHFIINFNHIAFILSGGTSSTEFEDKKRETDKRYKKSIKNNAPHSIIGCAPHSTIGTLPIDLPVRNPSIYSINDNKLIKIENDNKGNDNKFNTLDTLDKNTELSPKLTELLSNYNPTKEEEEKDIMDDDFWN